MLFTACGDEMDESKMQPFVKELLAAMNQRGRSYIAETTFWDYSDGHPKLLETIRMLCWKRLTDDTRLIFYRDVYLHAKERFAKEEARVRFEGALGIWPFRPWALFWRSMQLMHAAAWRRSERHDFHVCQKRYWYSWTTYYEQAKARSEHCDKLAVVFLADKHRKIIRSCMDTWLAHKRRQDEVVAADIRGRQLQQDLILLQQLEAERTLMEVEDKLSAVVEARALESDEMGRRRSFIAATDRVNANRKMQKQKEERIQYKTSRELAAELETKQAWAAIAEQVAAELLTVL
ncbi:uncharacterized protein IUM83_11604 [Phytophthora cinnamomi]|uniref:uncharacterized protein n=1 Tax=Phytophthora cinnamomi TaxID=4785 RepID=UPI00355A3F26|nr:hypothetical protein IUM83_11604 [Phytophthora cinnamomi]